MLQKKYSNSEAISKLQKYCAYQERCHQEVDQKLYEWGFPGDDRDEIIVRLIEGNFLNEERFSRSFVRGKFKIKKWGRNKIRYELLQKGITEKLIEIAFEEIDQEDYLNTLKEVLEKKARLINDRNKFSLRQKLAAYLFNRGFEPELVWNKIKEGGY